MTTTATLRRLSAELRSRSREVADAFTAVAPEVGDRLEERDLIRWADVAGMLADRAPQAAVAFISGTPAALNHVEPADLEPWASQGTSLITGGWRSAQIATQFFALADELLGEVGLDELDLLVEAVVAISPDEPDIASLCLADTSMILGSLDRSCRRPFLALLQEVARRSRAEVYDCVRRLPGLIGSVTSPARAPLLELGVVVAAEVGSGGFQRFATAAGALAAAAPDEQEEIVALAAEIAALSASAAVTFLASAPEVWETVGADEARRWAAAGADLLTDPEGGDRAAAWFRRESAQAQEMLTELTGRVELAEVSGVLGRYAQALCGRTLGLHPRSLLGRRRIGWTADGGATTDGLAIFLPPSIELFDDHASNYSVYKVAVTQQAARLEFGSFDFRFGVDGGHLVATYPEREGADADRVATPMTRFFALFADRPLVVALFGLAETLRIDSLVATRYPGVRAALRRLQDLEGECRPSLRDLPLREAFVENLIRASLGRADLMEVPEGIADAQAEAVAVLEVVAEAGATVQDSAEVAAILYEAAEAIPNAIRRGSRRPTTGGTERPFMAPPSPDMQGDFKPELVQLMSELTEQAAADGEPSIIGPDEVESLLETTTEIDADDEDAEALIAALDEEVRRRVVRCARPPGDDEVSDGEVEWFRYDEWDFHARDYRPAWCRVGEMVAEEGELDFYQATLARRHGLVVTTRRQFEKMRPEAFRRLKRLEDGHEIDLDDAIEFHADKLAGAGPIARFYSRRDKVTRDVAVAFLLDMSASTNEELTTVDGGQGGDPGAVRIIDVEKESAVVMIEALEAIGDRYGIFGFSGEGRESVEFRVIKEIDEEIDDRIRRRVGGVEPVRATRMGPAIRHAVTKLDACDARVKILVLISDGRPMDEEYGSGESEREYAVQDTRQALTEARRRRIEPFLITVDREGHDYLGELCGDLGYEVVPDVEALPKRLVRLYERVAIR